MIAKVICQGSDRSEAIMRMRHALEMFVVQGVTTTIPFLARLMQDRQFQTGDVHTKFLEQEGIGLLKPPDHT
jgi:acetyl-CoA carboxylase biotin carboxylase subunit